MPTYDVTLPEGKEDTVFRVEAASEDEAIERATAFREQRFRERFAETGQAEADAARAELERVNKMFIPQEQQGPGLDTAVPTSDFVGGAIKAELKGMGASLIDSASGLLQSASDFIVGTTGSEKAGAVSDKLGIVREAANLAGNDAYTDFQEFIVGRPLTPEEHRTTVENAVETRKVYKGVADFGLTAGPMGKLVKGATGVGTLARGAGVGALSGWMMGTHTLDEKQRFEDRIGGATVGGVLGSGFAAVPAVIAGAKNVLINKLDKLGGGKGAMAARRAVLEEFGISTKRAPLTQGQVSGNPETLATEIRAAGSKADELFRAQQEEIAQLMATKAGIGQLRPLSEMGTGSREVLNRATRLAERTIGKIKGLRNKAFGRGLAKIETENPNLRITMSDDFADAINAEISTFSQYSGAGYDPAFVEILGQMQKLTRGGLTPTETNALLLNLQAIKKTGQGIFDAHTMARFERLGGHSQSIANTFKKTIERGMDDLVENNAGNAAWQKLGQLRAKYARRSAQVEQIEDELMGALKMKGTAFDVLNQLGKSDPKAVRHAMAALRRMPGGKQLVDDLKGAIFEEAVRTGSGATLGGAAKAGDFNLRAFSEALGSTMKASKLKGFITHEQEAQVVRGLELLKSIYNHPSVGSKQGVMPTFLGVDLQSLTINALSRNPGFMGRMVAASIERGEPADWLFFTQDGIELLTQVRQLVHGGGTHKVSNALTALLVNFVGASKMEEWANEKVEPEQR